MRLMVVLGLGLFLGLAWMPLAQSGSLQAVDEERREYVGGGEFAGTSYICMSRLHFDIFAACDIRCPGGTCNIIVIDDVRELNIGFRICFDGETFCRPNIYWGKANVPGSRVTVVPLVEHATHGVVIVR